MVNYLNPYLYGNYLEETIIPWYEQNLYLQNLGLNISPIVTNSTESNIDNLRGSISFDLEEALALNNELEQQFIENTKNIPTETEKLNWLSNLGDTFSIWGKNIKQGFSKGIDILSNNQGLQNTAFGLVNSFIQPVNSSSGENTFFTVGDAFADKLKSGTGLAAKTAMTALKVLNSAGGKRTLDFSINQNAINPVIGSYNGSSTLFTDAASKAGLKYSVLNDKKRREADVIIREAKKLQNAITNLALEAEDLLAKIDYSGYLNYQNEINGNFDLRFYRIGKKGLKLENINRLKNINFTKKSKSLKTLETLESSKWEPQIVQIDSFLSYQKGGSLISEEKNNSLTKQPRTLEELIAYAKEKNPRFIQRMSEPLRYVKVNFKDNEGRDAWEHSTHIMTNKGNVVFPLVLEDPQGKLFIFNDPEKALNWAILNNNVLTFNTEEEAINFKNNYKQGWNDFFNTSPLDITPEAEYEEYEPYKYRLLNNTNEQFKEGGKLKEEIEELKEETTQKNIIPEGALHKNKHHMENTDGLTLKGIPVVDNDGDLLAEIECDELILNLENTKFIEERYKKYYSDELTQKEKDQLAVEVGELLVQEILHNTDDRTGLIDKVE